MEEPSSSSLTLDVKFSWLIDDKAFSTGIVTYKGAWWQRSSYLNPVPAVGGGTWFSNVDVFKLVPGLLVDRQTCGSLTYAYKNDPQNPNTDYTAKIAQAHMPEASRIRGLLAPVAAEFVTAVTTDTNGSLVTAASAKMRILSNMLTPDNTTTSSYDNISVFRQGSTINSSVIMQLKNKGDTILNIAGIVYTSYVIGTAVVKGGAATVPGRMWDFASGTVTGLATFLETISIIIFTMVMGLVTLGVMLAVIIPMTPFMIWTMGIEGLMVLIIKSLVASVLWAVMIMHPSGEGIMSDHSRQGLMILLMLFARPALMLVGMEAGIFMTDPLVNFVNDMFAFVFKSTQSETMTGFFIIFGVCSIYVTLVLAIVRKSFSMIHVVPDRVLMWIGGGPSQLGESEIGDKGEALAGSAGTRVSNLSNSSKPNENQKRKFGNMIGKARAEKEKK